MFNRCVLGLVTAMLLAGCASNPAAPPAGEGWHPVALPGKEPTRYEWTHKEGRPALWAHSEKSASMWRRTLTLPPESLREVSFSWWLPSAMPQASVADVRREDAPVRVLLAFAGDESKLPWRTRALYDMAEALTGERPPFATLMYVWDAHAERDSVIVNPRTDRVRKIAVDAGLDGLAQWRDHRRDIVADYRRAFGEDPGPLVAVAVMTDTDNTESRVEAWYGPIRFH